MLALENVLREDQRTYVFVDGPNLYAAGKALGFDIDYRKLRQVFVALTNLQRIHYYTPAPEATEYSSVRPLLDWLDYNGYTMETKPPKEFITEAGERRLKGNLNIELSIQALRYAFNKKMDHLVLISGNADFQPLVLAVNDLGVQTTVISSLKTRPVFVADEMRRAPNFFVELGDMGIEKAQKRA